MHKNVFDLDNTLVYTDELNSAAYNHALAMLGRNPINYAQRITRKVVFEKYKLTKREKEYLLTQKQLYFNSNLHNVHKNEELFEVLLNSKRDNCLLWTSAESRRVEAILDYFKLDNAFSLVFYSDKSDIIKDVNAICEHFSCSYTQLKFYENDEIVLDRIKCVMGFIDKK